MLRERLQDLGSSMLLIRFQSELSRSFNKIGKTRCRKGTLLRLIGIALFPLLFSGCDGVAGPDFDSVIWLPTFPSCNDDVIELRENLKRVSVDARIGVANPDRNFVREYRLNSLVRIEFRSTDKDTIDPMLDTFMGACGPNSVLETGDLGINRAQLLKLMGTRAPAQHRDARPIEIQLKDDTVLIFQ